MVECHRDHFGVRQLVGRQGLSSICGSSLAGHHISIHAEYGSRKQTIGAGMQGV